MSISKRIRDQIKQLNVDQGMKDMMNDILRTENLNSSGYEGAFDKAIKTYLQKKEEGGRE